MECLHHLVHLCINRSETGYSQRLTDHSQLCRMTTTSLPIAICLHVFPSLLRADRLAVYASFSHSPTLLHGFLVSLEPALLFPFINPSFSFPFLSFFSLTRTDKNTATHTLYTPPLLHEKNRVDARAR